MISPDAVCGSLDEAYRRFPFPGTARFRPAAAPVNSASGGPDFIELLRQRGIPYVIYTAEDFDEDRKTNRAYSVRDRREPERVGCWVKSPFLKRSRPEPVHRAWHHLPIIKDISPCSFRAGRTVISTS
jgi:hypothetical protein